MLNAGFLAIVLFISKGLPSYNQVDAELVTAVPPAVRDI